MRRLRAWLDAHPGKAGAIAGWYQQFASGLVTLAFIPLVENKLGEGMAGLWFTFLSLSAVVSLTDFGVGFVLARQVAWTLGGDKPEAYDDFFNVEPGWDGVSDLYAACRRAFTQMVIVGGAMLVIIHELVLPLGKLNEFRSSESTLCFYVLGVSMLLMVKNRQFQALLEGAGRMHVARFISGTGAFAGNLLALAVLLIWQSVAVMALAIFAASVIQLVVQRSEAIKVSEGKLSLEAAVPPGLQRALWKVAAPLGMVNTGSWLFKAVQVPLIGSILGPAMVTPFYVAQRIGGMLNAAVTQMLSPQMPMFTRALAAKDHRGAADRIARTAKLLTVIFVLANLAFVLLSPIFAHYWRSGRPFLETPALIIMGIDFTLLSCSVIWAHFVLASGRNPFAIPTIVAGLLTLVGCVVLGPLMGMTGIALSTLIAGLLTNYILAPVLGLRLLHRLRRSSESVVAGT